MRDPVAIIESAVDIAAVGKRVRQAHVALQDAERAQETAEKRAEGAREEAARRRLELGRALVEARKAWPARQGRYPVKVNGKTWTEWIADQGIEERNAQNWMRLAGFKESTGETDGDVSPVGNDPVPTLADAGIDKRPRKGDAPAPPPVDATDDEGDAPAASVCPTCSRSIAADETHCATCGRHTAGSTCACGADPFVAPPSREPLDAERFLLELADGLTKKVDRERLILWHESEARRLRGQA